MKLQSLLKNKIVKNAGWLVGGTLAQKVLAFVVGILSARYLGPSNFGIIHYADAYITFFSAICTLGISSVIIKDFVDYPDEQGTALGTALVLRSISSILSAIMIVGIVAIVDGDEKLTIVVTVLSCLSLPFHVFDALKQWFQNRLESKYCSLATLVAFAVMSAYKIALLAAGVAVQWFALATSVEYVIIAIFLLIAYKKRGGPALHFSWAKAKSLLSSSKSYILASLMASIYASTDKLMLKQMLGDADVGYYSLAVSLSTMFAFVLSAVIDSVYPTIVQAKTRSEAEFEKRNRLLYMLVFYGAVVMSLVIALGAKPIITVLYGEQYLPAIAPVRVVVWYTAFSYLGVARNAWVVCENKQKYLKYLYLGAALANVVLNYLLIPIWGTVGAAAASLATQVITIVFMPACIPALRKNVKLMLQGVFFRKVF